MKYMLDKLKVAGSKTPIIVTTGFTTAYLGDERTLREFIIGDDARKILLAKGKNSILYLINDSYDPLNYRQLRVGVNKDEKLLERFKKYCGQPISEIPDPFDCHENYSEHFACALLKRLHSIDIYPVILDSYLAYKNGNYSEYIDKTFNNYKKIKELLSTEFEHYSMRNLFRIQCPKCFCLDATNIIKVKGREVEFECERCGKSGMVQNIDEVRGKLAWKLDCAARWNMYGIDIETFSKSHIAELGSYSISSFISQKFYGGRVPSIIKYGDVTFSWELSNKLIKMLPPEVFKAIFSANPTRDLALTKEHVEHFCNGYKLKSGLSYVDYVRRELPKKAIHEKILNGFDSKSSDLIVNSEKLKQEKCLVEYGNNFSEFYYGKKYSIDLPAINVICSVVQSTVQLAQEVISYTLSLRDKLSDIEEQDINKEIRSYLKSKNSSPELYHYLRHLFGQRDGPNIATLLTILPKDYLNLIYVILNIYMGEKPEIENQSKSKKILKNSKGLKLKHAEIRS